jgi:hypothetical protein
MPTELDVLKPKDDRRIGVEFKRTGAPQTTLPTP